MPADPFEQLGLSRRPVYEIFGSPDVSRGGYSPTARRAAERDQAILENRRNVDRQRAEAQFREEDMYQQKAERARQQEADAVADQFYQQAPSTRQKFLEDNPVLARSRDYGNISDMVQREPSYADRVLGNSIANRIDDPDARKVFLDHMAKGGTSAEARNLADRFANDRITQTQLAGAGFSAEERAKLKGKSPDVIAYALNQRREQVARAEEDRRMGRGSSSSSRDPRLDALKNNGDFFAKKAKVFQDSFQPVPDELQSRIDANDALLSEAYGSIITPKSADTTDTGYAKLDSFGVLRPRERAAPAPAPAADLPPKLPETVEEMDDVLAQVPFGQKEARIKEIAEEKQAQGKINEAWSAAKDSMEYKLRKIIPDEKYPGSSINKLEDFARAVLKNETIAEPMSLSRVRSPVWSPVFKQLGIKGGSAAFKNPDKSMFSRADPTNEDVVRAWAQSFLTQREVIGVPEGSPQGTELTPDVVEALNVLDTEL